MADDVEKTIQAGYTVNEDGICQPRFYLAPYRHPHYFEPDKETFKIVIPDLARRATPSKKVELVRDNGNSGKTDVLLGFDFGTSMSSIVGLELERGLCTVAEELPFFTPDYIQQIASSEITVEASEMRRDDRDILRLLEDVDSNLARAYRQVLADLQTPRYSFKGTAAELRVTIELLLEKLAPDEEAQKFGIKPDPVLKKVGYAARATYVLKKKRAADEEGAKKCTDSVRIIEEGVGNVLRGMHKRASTMVHMGAEDERNEVVRLQNYFRALVVDLLE
jgi:hypothetical protein